MRRGVQPKCVNHNGLAKPSSFLGHCECQLNRCPFLNSNLFGFIDAYQDPLLGAFHRFIASSLKVAFGVDMVRSPSHRRMATADNSS